MSHFEQVFIFSTYEETHIDDGKDTAEDHICRGHVFLV